MGVIDPMNIYEGEDEARTPSVLEFLKTNKQLVWMAVAFVLAYAFMSYTSNQMDEMVAKQDADKAAAHHDANPWAKDQ